MASWSPGWFWRVPWPRSRKMKDVAPDTSVFGSPALEVGETFRIFGAMRKLPELLRRVAKLERDAGQE